MDRSKNLRKLFSSLAVVVFFMTNTLTPVPSLYAQTGEFLNPFSPFEIPAEWGRVTDLATVPKSSRVLIHIQEAHANYDAQKNISNILRYLNKSCGVKLVLVEGAGNRLRPELFKFFPKDAELQAAVTQKLMEAGELTGAEVFLMGASQNSEGWGVEKAEAYAEDREAFREVLEGQKIAEDFLSALYFEWQKQASLFFNKDLREFLIRSSLFEEKKIPLGDWLKNLKGQSLKTLKMDLGDVHQQIEWPILVRYFRLKEIDSQINAAKVPKEINAFLGHVKTLRIAPDVLKEAEAFLRNDKDKELPAYKTRFVFEKLLDALPSDYSFDSFPNLRLHIQQLILLSELQADRLRNEARELAKRMVDALARTGKERHLTGLFREYQLVRKLFRLELNREEYEALKDRHMTPETLVKDFGVAIPDLSRIGFLWKTAMRFYEGAVEREKWLIQNSFARMKDRKQSRAVLITGGFHTDGLKEKALQGGSSYFQITPAISEITPDTRKNYLTTLLGRDTVAQSYLASIPASDIIFIKKTTPDWHRFLVGRWTRIKDIVYQTVVSMRPGRSNDYQRAVTQALRSFITDSPGISVSSVPPAGSTFRSERRSKQHAVTPVSAQRYAFRSDVREQFLSTLSYGIWAVPFALTVSVYFLRIQYLGSVIRRLELEYARVQAKGKKLFRYKEQQNRLRYELKRILLAGPAALVEQMLKNVQERHREAEMNQWVEAQRKSRQEAEIREILLGRSEMRNENEDFAELAKTVRDEIGDESLVNALREAGHPVTFIKSGMSVDEMADRIRDNQVIYFAPPIIDTYDSREDREENYFCHLFVDYWEYKNQMYETAKTLIGPALQKIRQEEASNGKPRQRKVFILQGIVESGTSKLIYDTIKWNAHPPDADDYDFDLVFQPDVAFPELSPNGPAKEPLVVFGLMKEDDGRSQASQNATQVILNRIFGQFYKNKKMQYMHIRSAEILRNALLIYLSSELVHFNNAAELSRVYGADLSTAAFSARLDERFRPPFTNPSLGFGGKLFADLCWIYAQEHYKKARKLADEEKVKPTREKIFPIVARLEKGIQHATEILEQGLGADAAKKLRYKMPPRFQLLFTLRNILRINRQSILDFLKNTIVREYDRLQGTEGSLKGKKVALWSVGRRSTNGQITDSSVLLLIKRLILDEEISEFYIADLDAKSAFEKWVENESKENPQFKTVRFEFTSNIYEIVAKSDLTIIPAVSNKVLKDIKIEELGRALNGKPVFDGVNFFGLQTDGTYQYKLEDIRRARINLFCVGRPPLGPVLDNQTDDRLEDSTVIRDVAGYEKAIAVRETRKQARVTFRQKTVTMVGCGRVGLVTAASLSALGHKIHMVDVKDKQKEIDALNGSETVMPFYEPGLREKIVEGKAKGLLTFSTDLETAVKDSSIVYLAVETPSQEITDIDSSNMKSRLILKEAPSREEIEKVGKINLDHVFKTFENIGDVIKRQGAPKTIVIKSTITPDTFKKTDEILRAKGLILGKDYTLVSNPEFSQEGRAIEDISRPDRTLLGVYAALAPEDRMRAEKEILELWYPLMVKYPHPVILTDTSSSTFTEYLVNSFLTEISIALSNIVMFAAEEDVADFVEICEQLAADDRIGRKVFFAPGIGHDVLTHHFSLQSFQGKTLSLGKIAAAFNDRYEITNTTVTKMALNMEPPNANGKYAQGEEYNPLEGKSVVVLGMSSEPGTDDMHDAYSGHILRWLLSRNVTQIKFHDPVLSMPNAPEPQIIIDHFLDFLYKFYHTEHSGIDGVGDRSFGDEFRVRLKEAFGVIDGLRNGSEYFKKHYWKEKKMFPKLNRELSFQDRIIFEPDLEKLGQADIVYVATEWDQYKNIDLSKFKKKDQDLIVVDGKNLFHDRRNEITAYASYMGAGIPFLPRRSELRRESVPADEIMVSDIVEAKTPAEFFRLNQQKGGGSERGVRDVTVKIVDGVIPLFAHLLKVPQMVFDVISPPAYAHNTFDVTTKPEMFPDHAQFAAAAAALGIKTLTAGDVLVLGRKFALDQGAVAAVRTVLGDVPVLVYTGNKDDIGFLKKLNAQLVQARRPPILVARNADEAKKLLDGEAGRLHKAGVSSIHSKAMVYEAESLPKELVKQLSDVTVVNARMFKNFLALAGDYIHSLVQEIQQQFAFSRSA